jgi:hypothetical protein
LTTSVSFRKQVSDGNYGSEVAEVTLDVDVEYLGESALSDVDKACEDEIAAALATARRLVLDELRCSPSPAVRRALAYPEQLQPVPASPDGVDVEDLPF